MACMKRKVNRVSGKGTATVRFSVDGAGNIGGASIARSSGSARFDREAARAVARARKCAKPPAGAQRIFSIRVKGK